MRRYVSLGQNNLGPFALKPKLRERLQLKHLMDVACAYLFKLQNLLERLTLPCLNFQHDMLL